MTRLVKFDGSRGGMGGKESGEDWGEDSSLKYPAIFSLDGFNSADERRAEARARRYMARVQITAPAAPAVVVAVANDRSLPTTPPPSKHPHSPQAPFNAPIDRYSTPIERCEQDPGGVHRPFIQVYRKRSRR